ncbi:hypothetical protein GQ44DRAFT_708404 [Phaeosphaeriaceae sp. PMI808]|nr:hypothetical protein GQ44DRAFT_708404 [Phaeosphaeriaceae sp. PMI808]
MAAKGYYNQRPNVPYDIDQQQHLLSPSMSSPGMPSGPTTPLKPLHLLSHEEHAIPNHNPNYEDYQNVHKASQQDRVLKTRIRRFRIASRLLAFFISIAVLVPITMTLVTFLRTQNTYRPVTLTNGQTVTRTAWAKNTRAWPTWAYFGIALFSLVLNFATVFSYKFGFEQANVASLVTSSFTWIVMIGNLSIWTYAAGMYRREKDKDGKSDDLWGWTCSAPARAIQREFAGEVNFNTQCNVQSVSWYIGLVQAGSALFTIIIYIFVFLRKRSKKNLNRQMRLSGFEPGQH